MNNNKIGRYYQKSSFMLKIARYIIVLSFIIFLIFCILINRKDITVENIQFLAKYITLNDGSSHFYKDEFQVNVSDEADVFMLRDNVVIIESNGIDLYELSGTKLFNYQFAYSSPAFVKDTHNILVYDIKGNELSIFNSFSRVFTQKYPSSIRCADINNKGFAVITGEKGYRSALIVYNENFKEKYKWLSEENYLTSLSLSSDGKYVAITSANAEKGAYECDLRIIDTTKDTPKYISESFDELPLLVNYSQDCSNLYVITDGGIRFYNEKAELSGYYKFNQSKIENYYLYEDLIILTEKNNLSGSSLSITAISSKGNKMFEVDVNDEIHDIAIGRKNIFVLGRDCVYKYTYTDSECKLKEQSPLNAQYLNILTDSDGNCYLTDNSNFVKVDFKATQQKEN